MESNSFNDNATPRERTVVSKAGTTVLAEDREYVYDPDHLHRPHDGKPWLRTPRGWTLKRPDSEPAEGGMSHHGDLSRGVGAPFPTVPGERDCKRMRRVVERGVDKVVKAALDRERAENPGVVRERIKRCLGVSESAVRSSEACRQVAELLKRLRERRDSTKESRRQAILEAIALPGKAEFVHVSEVGEFTAEQREYRREAFDFLGRLASQSVLDRPRIRFFEHPGKILDGRIYRNVRENGCSYSPEGDNPESRIHISEKYGPSGVAHELAHAISNANPGIKRICMDFFESRTAGEEALTLDQANAEHYGDPEMINKMIWTYPPAKRDHFLDPYTGMMGSEYFGDDGKILADQPAELFPTGVEYLFEDPETFFESDPEHFRLVVQCLRYGGERTIEGQDRKGE